MTNLVNMTEVINDLLNEMSMLKEYQWLIDNSREVYLNSKHNEFFNDTRTKWELPTLICAGPVGGHKSFREAVQTAMKNAKTNS